MITTLRSVYSAQTQFRHRGIADADGIGEYGTFAEMSAITPVRGGPVTLRPAVLSASFTTINATGEAVRQGYLYRMFLPGAGATGLAELPLAAGAPAGIDPELTETMWCCYAWPSNYESSGVRTFFINQAGDLVFADVAAYSGPGAALNCGAALVPGDPDTVMSGAIASGINGRDGNLWRSVQQ